MRQLVVLAWTVAVVTLVSACGGDEKSTRTGVVLDEWSVTPAMAETEAGKVIFEVRNEGSMPHQLVVIKNDLPPEMLPVANGSLALSQLNVVRSMEAIAADATSELQFDATPGKYVLVCNLPGHYQQGMATSFLVEP